MRESASPGGTGDRATSSSGVKDVKEVKLQSLDREIKEKCLFWGGSIIQSIRKHQSVAEIVFRESEGTARHWRVLCMTMKPEAALIKNGVRKEEAVAAR